MLNRIKYSLIKVFRKHSLPRWSVLVIDLSAVFLLFLLAYMLRYNLEPFAFSMDVALKQGLFVSGIYFCFMLLFKSYSGLIRQTTIKDAFLLGTTTTTSFLVLMTITYFSRNKSVESFFNISYAILTIQYGIATTSLTFFRVLVKMFYIFVSVPRSNKKNVLIYGSGNLVPH